ncbi:MAG: PepSY-like domain-containing protein [Planctomycetota bacterium]|jgi:hypothetical protein
MLCVSLTIPLTLALSACTGLGTSSLVGLYDQGKPDGMIEVELDRNGAIREMEADIPTSDLPANIREAAMAKAPGGEIKGAEREITAAGTGWEVKMKHQGRMWEFVMDNDGKILETEKELTKDEAPAAVLQAADRAISGGTFVSVELIERGDESEYHVKKARDGASYKIVLTADGTVKRKVREAKAEIEIPLKN